jgi:hypothetical protein
VHVAGGTVTKGSRKIDSKHTKVIYKIGAWAPFLRPAPLGAGRFCKPLGLHNIIMVN